MKKIMVLMAALLVSNSAFGIDIAKITQNVKEVCQSPSQAGSYWNVTATGKADAKGGIRVASVGVNGEATFTQGQWDGVQQVLKAQQSADNASYRHCAEKLTDVFVKAYTVSAPEVKSIPAKKAKLSRTKNTTKNAKERSKNIQTIGSVTADKVININDMSGDINMGSDK